MTQSNIDPRYVEKQEAQSPLRQSQKQQPRKKTDFIHSPLPDIALVLLIIGAGWLLGHGLSVTPGTVMAPTGLTGLLAETGGILVGLPAFVVGVMLGVWRMRWQINRYEGWWNTHCPHCRSKELKRTYRRPFDRLLGRLGIPVRRYICTNCQWEGRRIDPWRVH